MIVVNTNNNSNLFLIPILINITYPLDSNYFSLILILPNSTMRDIIFSPLPYTPISLVLDFSLISSGILDFILPRLVLASIVRLEFFGRMIFILPESDSAFISQSILSYSKSMLPKLVLASKGPLMFSTFIAPKSGD